MIPFSGFDWINFRGAVSITLQNFQCYGPEALTIELDNLTTLIGANGCGKTAILKALCRLFGTSSNERRIRKEDFHIPFDTAIEDLPDEMNLAIEVCLSFPELENGQATSAIPPCFNQMSVKNAQGQLICRIRLEATWSISSLVEGDIEEKVFWITEPTGTEAQTPMTPAQRSRIHVLYVPATRDPSKELRNISGTLLHRLLKAINWSDNPINVLEQTSESIKSVMRSEEGVKCIEESIQQNWADLHKGRTYSEPHLEFSSSRIEDILKQVDMLLSPSEEGTSRKVDQLSDGLKSLFYLTLVSSIFDVEQQALIAEDSGPIDIETLNAPLLTLFAIEEPENHLAPHYLGRIINLFKRISQHSSAQVIISSHSASILKRIDPSHIRYFQLVSESQHAVVQRITLPTDEAESYMYVKEAIQAYPELYFASLVILVEGDSEEIALPRLIREVNNSIEDSFISIVPLSGRHVNYFWKLLNNLNIPYITLLDLDLERSHGGWGTIKYACKQLVKIGQREILQLGDGSILSDEGLEQMDEWTDVSILAGWINALENNDVYFSAPLDFDFLMLESFKTFYFKTANRGPNIPTDPVKKQERIQKAILRVLGENGGNGNHYTDAQKELFPWYTYLFLDNGKPTTHFSALSSDDGTLCLDMPAVITRLTERINQKLTTPNA